jgi:hypothetical protein
MQLRSVCVCLWETLECMLLSVLENNLYEIKVNVGLVCVCWSTILSGREEKLRPLSNSDVTQLHAPTAVASYALSKVRICLRHNLCSQPYGSKSLVRSTESAV